MFLWERCGRSCLLSLKTVATRLKFGWRISSFFVQPVAEAFFKRVLRQQTRRVLKELDLHETLTILDTGSTDGLGYILGYPKKKYLLVSEQRSPARS